MAEYKPLGSEKLQGDDKLRRILELTYYNENNKKSSTPKAELVKESKSTGVYGIVRERDGYYVKKGLNESSLDYIGGMFMKNKNKFSSYAEALKRLELLKGQEDLQEATKYVLKPSAPKTESPLSEPASDAPMPTPPSDEVPAEAPAEAPMDAPAEGGEAEGGVPEVGDEEVAKRSDYMTEIQKYAGKLGQQLRDEHERMESDDIKYVLNMIISAVDLDKLDDEDIEEIGKKFEREDEEGGEEVPAEAPADGGEEVPAEAPADSELGENMDKLEEFINSNTPSEQDEIDLSKYADLEVDEQEDDFGYAPDPDSAYEDKFHIDDEPSDFEGDRYDYSQPRDSFSDDDEMGGEHEKEMNDKYADWDNMDEEIDEDIFNIPEPKYDGSAKMSDREKELRKYGKEFGRQALIKRLKSENPGKFKNYDDDGNEIKHKPERHWNEKRRESLIHMDEEDEDVEIDLDEIKNEINNHISSTLSKYFK